MVRVRGAHEIAVAADRIWQVSWIPYGSVC